MLLNRRTSNSPAAFRGTRNQFRTDRKVPPYPKSLPAQNLSAVSEARLRTDLTPPRDADRFTIVV